MSQVHSLPGRTAIAIPLLALMLSGAATASQYCGPEQGPSRLTVWGEGQSRIAPDLATVQLGVTTQADSATMAMTQNAEQQNAVIEALREAGLEQAAIQTSGLNLTPLMRYGEGTAPEVTGYQAQNLVTIRVSDIDNLGQILDAIVSAGANEIQGISFTRENGTGPLAQARRAAVMDARAKAELLAEASGVTLGPILALREIRRHDGGARPMMRVEAAMDNIGTPVQQGELSMTAEVEIDYALTGDNTCAMQEPTRDRG